MIRFKSFVPLADEGSRHLGFLFAASRILLLAVACWQAIVAVCAMTGSPTMPYTTDIPIASESQHHPKTPSQARGLNAYTSVLNYGSLFGRRIAEIPDTSTQEVQSRTLQELLIDYQIQGTVWGETPTVLIYDKKNSTTLTLCEGDKIGEIEIVKIQKSHVRFRLLGEIYDAKY